MKIINSKVQLTGIRLYGFHGVSDEEQTVGSWFEINISIETNISPQAFLSDKLEGTLDYSKVLQVIEEVFSHKVRLLEHLAYKISEQLISQFQEISQICIQVRKMTPPMPTNVKSSSVELVVKA